MSSTSNSSGLLPIFMLVGLVFLVVAVYMGTQKQEAAAEHEQAVQQQYDQAQQQVDQIQLDPPQQQQQGMPPAGQ